MTALVTGAGSGIGASVAARLAAEGAHVAIVDRDAARAADVAGGIEASGGRALAVTADVTDELQVASMLETIEAELGSVNLLVNGAYSVIGEDVLATTQSDWNTDIAGTLTSAFLCIRAVLPEMITHRQGVIVNIASVNGLAAFGVVGAYSAAKAGLISLTKNLAVRYGHFGIRVVAVAPGTVRTRAWDKELARDPQVFDRMARLFPLGRVGEPEDVASAIAFLASPEAAWITGTVLRVDGGITAGYLDLVPDRD